MSITYRLVDSKGEMLSDADSIQDLRGILGRLDPGRYTVDEIAAHPLPSGHTARRWGVLLKLNDGTIIEEPDPWDD